MTKKEIAARADATFDAVLSSPNGSSAIITARRVNSAPRFKAGDLSKLPSDAKECVEEALEVVRNMKPSLDRFRA